MLAAFEQVLTAGWWVCEHGLWGPGRAGGAVGLLALLKFFDQEPALERLCVVASAQAGAGRAGSSQVLDRLARVPDDERAPPRFYSPTLNA